MCVRSNYDIKLITNAFGTNNITWYITTYATKKQSKSSNASAILTKTIAFHKATDHARQRCQDFKQTPFAKVFEHLGASTRIQCSRSDRICHGLGRSLFVPSLHSHLHEWDLAAIFNAFPLVRHVNHFVYFDELLTLMEMKVTTE